MRKYLKIFSLVLFCVVAGYCHNKTDDGKTIKKKVVKSYKTAEKSQLIIDNQYGDVEIKTWNKNEIRIEVFISGNANTVQRASELTKNVHIASSRIGNKIVCLTYVGKIINQTSSKESCNVLYQIYMPSTLQLNVKNRFGNIFIGDYAGLINIDQKYGSFSAGSLKQEAKIKVEQGSISIAGLHGGTLEARGFSRIWLGRVSGSIDCGLSSGKLLDISLSDELKNLVIKSGDIKTINLNGIKKLKASYELGMYLCRLANKSALQFTALNPSSVRPSGSEKNKSANDIISQKKAKADDGTKRYISANKNSTAKIKIAMALSLLNINN